MYRGALPLTWQLREINHLPGITFFWQICSHRPGSRANGLQSISVKDTPSINYSVTCASVLQYLQCCTKLLSQQCTVPEAAFAWAIIPSALPLLRGGERQGAFITDQKTSLEVPACKHDWGLMRGLHCADVINEAGEVSSSRCGCGGRGQLSGGSKYKHVFLHLLVTLNVEACKIHFVNYVCIMMHH